MALCVSLSLAAMSVARVLGPLPVISRPTPRVSMQLGQQQQLPHPWEAAVDPNGDVYYYNAQTGAAQWEPPAQDSAQGVVWRVAGISGVKGQDLYLYQQDYLHTKDHDAEKKKDLPYCLRSGDEQVLSRWNMLKQKLTVSRVQCMVKVSPDGTMATLVSCGRGATLWRARGGAWNGLSKDEKHVLADGDQVSLDVNDPEAAVFECQKEGAALQQQGGYDHEGGFAQHGQPSFVQAEYAFTSPEAGQLFFQAVDVIEVTQQGEPDGWWEGSLNGQVGWFPSNFCSAPR